MEYKNKKIFISIISFVMILTLVFSPLVNIVSNAEEISLGTVVSNPFTVISLPSSILQRSSIDDHSPFIFGSQYTGNNFSHLETVYAWWLSDGVSMSVRDGQFKWYGEYFVLKGDSNNWNGGYIASVPNGSFFVGYYDYNNNPNYASYRLYVPKDYIDDNSISKFPMWWSPSMVGTDKYSQFESPNNNTVNVSDSSQLVTIDGDDYYYFSNLNGSYNNFILQTSLPVYVRDNYNFDEISDLGSNVNPNYSGGSSSSETAFNNLVMDSADWTFKHNDYYAPYSDVINTGDPYPIGNINFSFLPNDYQLENSSEFNVVLSFSFNYDVNYISNNDNPPFVVSTTLTNPNKQKNMYSNFSYNDDGATNIIIPLDTFISNGNQASYTFKDIFDKLNNGSISLNGLIRISKEVDSISYNKFNLNCFAYIESGNDKSGNYTEWYNPINRKGYTIDKSGTVNNNPYVQSDEIESNDFNVPGTAGTDGDNSNNIGGGSASASASTGSITINNNNSNISNEISSSGFLSSLLKILANNQESSSESISSIAGTNGWINVINSTYSAFPTSFLNVLLISFSAVIGIAVIAFIIRILFDMIF